MIVGVFSKDDIRTELPLNLLESLRKAAEHDPFLAKRTNGKKKNHHDGWGYVLITSSSIYEYKSLDPIYTDYKGYKQLINILEHLREKSSSTALLIHARLASPGYSKVINDTHPFHFYTNDNYDAWLIMNGTLTGFFTKYQDGRSDTYGLIKYISGKKFWEIPKEILTIIINNPNIVKLGIAIGVLGVKPSCNNKFIEGYFIYYRRDYKEKTDEYYDYYRLTTDKSIVFMSSTARYYLDEKSLPASTRIEKLAVPSLITFSIDVFNDIIQIDVGTP